jgi:glycine/D-amino acid oxidase-like deaminating enzyme
MAQTQEKDIVIAGAGNIGSALAYGLSGSGLKVALCDQGDTAYRAAFGNFGLVWFQGKGLGMPHYAQWSLQATRQWPEFARQLERESAQCVDYQKPGGLHICKSEKDFADRALKLQELARQSKSDVYDCEMIDSRQLRKMIPRMKLGSRVRGASFSRHDGHVNPLYLIRALHKAFILKGGEYYPGHEVRHIQYAGGHFRIDAGPFTFMSPRLVLAAGVGIPALASKLGLRIPVRPQRGQLIVTERLVPMLPYPISGIRQTCEGSFMLGVSNEEVGLDTSVTTDVLKKIALNAVEVFPELAGVRMQRCWAALRPLAPDHFPIYHQSSRFPGAYVITSHSGVTLAPLYAGAIARWIIDGTEPQGFTNFSLRRFDV